MQLASFLYALVAFASFASAQVEPGWSALVADVLAGETRWRAAWVGPSGDLHCLVNSIVSGGERYERRSRESGDVLFASDVSSVPLETSFAFSPDETLVASRTFSLSGPGTARVRRLSDGSLVYSGTDLELSLGASIVWSSDSTRFYTVRETLQGLIHDVVAGTATPFSNGPQVTGGGLPKKLLYLPASDELLLIGDRDAGGFAPAGELYVGRLDGTTGFVNAERTLDTWTYRESAIDAVAIPEANRLWILVEQDAAHLNDPLGFDLVGLELDTLALVTISPVSPPASGPGAIAPIYFERALCRSDDGCFVAVAGGERISGVDHLVVTKFDATTGAALARSETPTTKPVLRAQAQFDAGARVVVVSYRQDFAASTVELEYLRAIEVEDAKVVWEVQSFGDRGLGAFTDGVSGDRVFVAGKWLARAEIRSLEVDSLLAGQVDLSASTGGEVVLVLDAEKARAGDLYLMLGSVSGTSPGIPVGSALLSLNPDAFFRRSLAAPNAPPLVDSFGVLDAAGTASARLVVPADSGLVGLQVSLAYLAGPPIDFASNAVTLTIFP